MLEPFQFPYVQRGIALVLVLSRSGPASSGRGSSCGAWPSSPMPRARPPSPDWSSPTRWGFPRRLPRSGAPRCSESGRGASRGDGGADTDSVTALLLVGALVVGVILASDVFHSGASVDTLLFGSLLLIILA